MKVQLPRMPFTVAVSGGIDSMVLANFVLKGKKHFDVLHFNHGTANADRYEDFVGKWCESNHISMITFHYSPERDEDPLGVENSEFAWSKWRNGIMQGFPRLVLTAHHANDSLESFLMRGSKIAFSNGNILRPLIGWKKSDVRDYAARNCIEYMIDPTNSSDEFRRNRIRNSLIPLMIDCGVNPFNLMDMCCNKSEGPNVDRLLPLILDSENVEVGQSVSGV